jgi:hypothetical protein
MRGYTYTYKTTQLQLTAFTNLNEMVFQTRIRALRLNTAYLSLLAIS